MDKNQELLADLDNNTIRFTISRGEPEVRAGDTLIVREVESSGEDLRVAAIPESVVKAGVEKLLT